MQTGTGGHKEDEAARAHGVLYRLGADTGSAEIPKSVSPCADLALNPMERRAWGLPSPRRSHRTPSHRSVRDL